MIMAIPGVAQQTAVFPVFAPHSSYANSIAALSLGVLWTTLGILVLVAGLVSYASHKFRAKPNSPTPKPIYGNTKLEIAYTVGFVLILSIISIFSVRAMQASDPPTRNTDDVLVIGHQWWWEIRYPKTGLVTANEIHIPVNQAQQVGLRAADVIHDFWVPELGRKMDMFPGFENRTWFAADTLGIYEGRCAEYCGQEHAWMRIRVIAQSPEDYRNWQSSQLAVPTASTEGQAAEGAHYFQDLSCASCHTIRGTPASARVGPDLTHVASRQTLAAGRLENTPQNLAEWLLDPDLVKPGCKMPNLHLTRQQQSTLVAYLETLR